MTSLAVSALQTGTLLLQMDSDGLFHQMVKATLELPPMVCPMLQPFAVKPICMFASSVAYVMCSRSPLSTPARLRTVFLGRTITVYSLDEAPQVAWWLSWSAAGE